MLMSKDIKRKSDGDSQATLKQSYGKEKTMEALLKNTQRTTELQTIILKFAEVISSRCNQSADKALGKLISGITKLRKAMRERAIKNGNAVMGKKYWVEGYTVEGMYRSNIAWKK
tara:strand:+ start:163 stop:507 length:345 start_codon:yes stop_codon:yes gene_type:complete